MNFSVGAVTRPSSVGDRHRWQPGETIGPSGLTLSQEAAIRGLHRAGHSIDHLAALYCVRPQVIGAIVRRPGTS
jgi:hypothetical protein